MYRLLKNKLTSKKSVATLQKILNEGQPRIWNNEVRSVSMHSSQSDNLFPERVDFPNRHIGPRDQDVVTMLDLLGYKVCDIFVATLKFC